MNRKLRMGMVGGGRGAFIGQVHRMCAQISIFKLTTNDTFAVCITHNTRGVLLSLMLQRLVADMFCLTYYDVHNII